jgi:GntR family transcriptional regulator / MocR family aminotransferase
MNELSIVLNTETHTHLYQQIYEHIKSEIKKGKLLAGEKLPSTRLLAEHLQVSRSTVKLSYEQLEAEGYLEARPSKGYYVCRVEELHQIEVPKKKEESYKKRKINMWLIFHPML